MRETVSRRLSFCAVSKLNFFYRRHKSGDRSKRKKEFIVWPCNGEWSDARQQFNAGSLGQTENSFNVWKLRVKVICCTYRNGKLNWLKLLCPRTVVDRNHLHIHWNYLGKVNRSAAQHDYINEQFWLCSTKRLNLSLTYWTPVESKIYKLKIREERRSEKSSVSFYSIHLLYLYYWINRDY